MMNLWSADENAAFSDAFDPFDFAAAVWPPPPQPSHLQIHQQHQRPYPARGALNTDSLLQMIVPLIDGARESWTYAIFWMCTADENSGQSLLRWGNAYYNGNFIDAPRTTPSRVLNRAEQEYRQKLHRELDSLVANGTSSLGNDAFKDNFTDTEWFFLVSMLHSFPLGVDLPGQAFLGSNPIWVSGSDRLLGSPWKRGRQGAVMGFQTIVCFPTATGVLELGSTDLIFHTSLLTSNARVLFKLRIGDTYLPSAAAPPPIDKGENDSTALWINDPSSSTTANGISNTKSAGQDSSVPIESNSDFCPSYAMFLKYINGC